MTILGRHVVGFIVICLVAVASLADDTGTVSLIGKNTSDPNTVGITLVLEGSNWNKAEPGNRSHFFTTKSGKYVSVANVVTLLDQNKTRVGELSPLIPSKAKKGDAGNGTAFESGITFHWEVQ